MSDLAEWLEGLGLGKYAPAFAEHEIDFALLPLLTDDDVRELGLPIGPRRRFLAAIAALQANPPPPEPLQRHQAERRQLTVMFVDLARSTSLALRLDPEAMRIVLLSFQAAASTEIRRLGYVAKLLGDGILAYFGWPQAHEDDARRAVLAGLAITEAVSKLTNPSGEPLACRVGIATGMVVVGDLIGEGTAREYAVVGPTPNLAARLQEVAGPGEVMIAETTRRLLGSGFAVEAAGEHLLKGHNEPVPLFRVLRQDASDRPHPRASGGDALIIGRDAERDALRRSWQEAKEGKLRTILLTGEAGIGKSRLIEGLMWAVVDDGAPCCLFQCSALHSDNPFWPVVQQLPGAKTVVERMLRAPLPDRGHAQHLAVDAITRHLEAEVSGRPMLLVLEDAQWADRATVALMRHLATAECPRLILFASRPDGEATFSTMPSVLKLPLLRLDEPSAKALLARIAGDRVMPARLRNEILSRGDGVPLFIEEMTRAVIEAAPVGNAMSVPATVRDSLTARLDVSVFAKAVAQIASCIGREFAEALLFRIADLPRHEVQEGLAHLLQTGLVLPVSAGRFRFRHGLVCDVAQESLLTPRRRSFHRRIAEELEVAPGDLSEREPELLAHHWFAAAEPTRAEAYFFRARNRVAHWEDQFDALADYLGSEAGEVIPFPGPSAHKLP